VNRRAIALVAAIIRVKQILPSVWLVRGL